MWVKICANTNLDDARMAADLGADALGFVFAPSARRVTVAEVAAITAHLPATVEKVGVFHSQDVGEIAQAVREAGLTGAQLHGGADLALLARLQEMLGDGVNVIQTLHWEVGQERAVEGIQGQLAALHGGQRVLLDSKVGTATGGTGVSFDWEAARGVFATGGLRMIVAGGLRPENVAEAIKQLQPWGVDVASGVEARPGKKDSLKVAAFIRKARKT